MKEFAHHLFLPRHSNNHRPRILHHEILLLIVMLLFFAAVYVPKAKQAFPEVLGINANITAQDLLSLTNQKRQEQGLQPLTLNDQLSLAAAKKAKDMFSKNYWAHNAPDGTTPWSFLNAAGYSYTYAGENLARGFTASSDVVSAWMSSPSHRDNMLSTNYKEIGFAIDTGVINSEETVLVVEMFGSRSTVNIASRPIEKEALPSAHEQQPQTAVSEEVAQVPETVKPPQTIVAAVRKEPVISSFSLSQNIGLLILSLLIGVLIIDMIVIERKKIVRLAGHNMDHIMFLAGIFIFTLLIARGIIL